VTGIIANFTNDLKLHKTAVRSCTAYEKYTLQHNNFIKCTFYETGPSSTSH